MNEEQAIGRLGDGGIGVTGLMARAASPEPESPNRLIAQSPSPQPPLCNRCGHAVLTRPWGCKNPCRNCGTVYPLGDCSD